MLGESPGFLTSIKRHPIAKPAATSCKKIATNIVLAITRNLLLKAMKSWVSELYYNWS